MISERERFLYMLSNQRDLPGDAVVVLAGQDAQDRLRVGVHAFAQCSRWISDLGGNPEVVSLVISGGVSGDGLQSAEDLESIAWSYGVSPSRIILEKESRNTHEQAVNVAKIAREKNWHRINLCCSSYHLPRAYLTFLKEMPSDCQIVPCPVKHTKWFGNPDGSERTRADLLVGEMGKIALYSEHVASYGEGLKALERWEQ